MERCTNLRGQHTRLVSSEPDPEILAKIVARLLVGASKAEFDPSDLRKSREIVFDDVPNDVEIDAEVPVDEPVPQAGDVGLRDLGMRGLQLGR